MRRFIAFAGLTLIALATARPAGAQAATDTVRLTLTEARTRALRANPDLIAARLDTAIAGGQLRQAAVPLRFNPSADALAPGGGKGGEIGLSQEVEIFGQRGARVSARRAGLDRADALVANAARVVVADVDRAFYRLAAASRRAQLADDILGLNQRLFDAAQRQLTAGEISRLDYNLVLVELGRSRSRALAARREREATTVELSRLAGIPSGTPIAAAIDPARHTEADLRPLADSGSGVGALDAERLTQLALEQRADLRERNAAVREAGAEVSVARREALPNLIVRGTSASRDDGPGRVVKPGIGITLPFFNRNRGEVDARRAAARQAELERSAAVARVRADVATALATYRSTAQEVDVLETTVLEPARQNRQLLETAYREGEVGLPVLLLIRNQVIDAELEYWAAWLAEREAFTALLEATGRNVPATEARRP